jgi:ATP-dependent helicase/nuclease subunit A
VIDSLPPWAMARNLVLQAGAGTGKTHALVTLALHVLSGATAKRTPVPPSRLVALTFTEKAGAEMRERLQRRITPLANGTPLHEAEPELNATFERLGLPTPGADVWQRIRRDIAFATIGTFHSFCAFQLRRLAPFVGLDPAFEVLDDDEARALFEDATEGYILSALAAGEAGVRALVDEFGLTSDRPRGLIELTRDVLVQLEEDGRLPKSLDDGRFSDALAAENLVKAVDRMQDAVADLILPASKTKGGFADLLREFQHVADSLAPASVEKDVERLTLLRKQLVKPRGDAGAAVARFDDALGELRVAAAGVRVAPLARSFLEVMTAVEQRYSAAKRTRNAVDFSDLQRLFRNALRDDPAARRDMKARIDTLLVDEFQDTSRLQLDIVAMLSEARAGEAELGVSEIAEAVRWEAGFLCIVGDRKQSIYEFRGADVSVFSRLREQLTRPELQASAARVEYLQRSYRSRPRLVSLVNALFKQAMPSNGLPFEVAFTEGDALTPTLDEEVTRPLGQLLQAVGTKAEDHRPDEAKRIAAHIDALLHDPKERLDVRGQGADAQWRAAEGRDIVLLFRRLTNVNIYRAALSERGIPHVLVGGGGFYATQEVLDAWALLRSLDDPTDAVASNALLRSPWCTLSDESISLLALVKNGEITAIRGVTLQRLLEQRPKLEDRGEQARLDALLDFVEPLLKGLDRLGAARTLSLALEELDYLAVVAPQSIAANLDKLLNILNRLEQRHTTPRGVVRTFTERIWFSHREPEAASTEESNPRCVRLMTIHQAKGLEFPIVILPECGASDPNETSRIGFERDLGLALNVRLESEQLSSGPGLDEIRGRLMARRRAESLRLFYVALTRARDHVVVSGVPGRSSWFDLFAALGDDHVRRVDVDPTIPPRAPDVEETPVTSPEDWQAPARLSVTQLRATVGQLSEFRTCPERFRLRHVIRLHDRDNDPIDERPLSHELLDKIDPSLEEPALRRAQLDALLTAEGRMPSRPEVAAARAEAEAMLGTRFAAEAAQLPPQQQLRGVPYSFRLALDEEQQLTISDRLDWALLTGGSARLVRYTAASEADASFALMTGALVLRKLLNGALPIEAATASLKPEDEIALRPMPVADLDAQETRLRKLGGEFLDSHATDTWARRERTFCDSITCGYRTRCFGRS